MAIEVRIPKWSESSDECLLAKWLKKEGDSVDKGEVIAEIETDKATFELEAPDSGTLQAILAPEGSSLSVGAVVALVSEQQREEQRVHAVAREDKNTDSSSASPVPLAVAQPNPVQPVVADADREETETPHGAGPSAESVPATPLARRMAALAGLDLGAISTQNPDGRIREAVVEAALGFRAHNASHQQEVRPTSASLSPQIQSAQANRIPLSRTRRTIARRMAESKRTTPHFYLTVDCCLDELLELRRRIGQSSDQPRPSITAFLIRAAALALCKVPEVNSTWAEDAVLAHQRIDIAVAVAAGRELITPVIRSADRKGIAAIAAELRDLTTRAREGRLHPSELEGGTFTISNLGMYGVQSLYAIINPPQSSILGMGASEERPVVRDHRVVIATVLTATLSADHRVLDGAVGAAFLREFKDLVQTPLRLLL